MGKFYRNTLDNDIQEDDYIFKVEEQDVISPYCAGDEKYKIVEKEKDKLIVPCLDYQLNDFASFIRNGGEFQVSKFKDYGNFKYVRCYRSSDCCRDV